MITGLTYEIVRERAEELGLQSKDGEYFTRHNQLKELLRSLGTLSSLKKFKSMREVVPASIVAVNPREGGWRWHWVVIASSRKHGIVLLDPKPGKPAPLVSFVGYKGTGMYVHAT
jgi:hypothetical protein